MKIITIISQNQIQKITSINYFGNKAAFSSGFFYVYFQDSYMKKLNSFIIIFLLSACSGGGGSSDDSSPESIPLSINVTNFSSNLKSYEATQFTVSANFNCNFNISSNDIYWLTTSDNKTFNYRAPITLLNEEQFNLSVNTIPSINCPSGSLDLIHNVSRYEASLKYVPSPEPYNYAELKTDYFASHNLGFGGISIVDRYSATICYPTPEDCETYEDELFGQDAHNMATGDFNGDGFEDIVVAWALFPHTIELEQKVYAPIHIYLNDGNGNLYENSAVYYSNEAPTHPAPYRLAIADFNDDGVTDFAVGENNADRTVEIFLNADPDSVSTSETLSVLTSTDGKSLDVSFQGMQSHNFGLDWETIKENPSGQLTTIETAIARNQAQIAQLGADYRALQGRHDFLEKVMDATEAELGNLVDADMGQEAARMAAHQIQAQLATRTLSIANERPKLLLNLFR